MAEGDNLLDGNNESKLNDVVTLGAAIFLGFLVVALVKFIPIGEPLKAIEWGPFGDFVGGLVNPIIALLNLYVSIKIALALSKFSFQQSRQQIESQRVQLNTQLLYQIAS